MYIEQFNDKWQQELSYEELKQPLRAVIGFLLNDATFFKDAIVPNLPRDMRDYIFAYYIVQMRALFTTKVHGLVMSYTETGIENNEILTFLRFGALLVLAYLS